MLDLLRQLRWQDLLDIVIVSIILYRILLIIKGTKAAQMLAGLGILLIRKIGTATINKEKITCNGR